MLLLSGLLLLTLAIAVLNTLVPLWLAQEHMSTWQVGVVSSSYFTGNLVGTLLTGYVIKRIGFNRSYYLASFIFAAGCAGLGLMIGFWSWLAWRFVAGIGCAMIWVVVESALMCSGTSRNRGRLLAAYMMVYYVGTFLGQLLVSKVSTELMSVLPWVTGLTLAGILPLLFTRVLNQQTENHDSTSIDQLQQQQQETWQRYFPQIKHTHNFRFYFKQQLAQQYPEAVPLLYHLQTLLLEHSELQLMEANYSQRQKSLTLKMSAKSEANIDRFCELTQSWLPMEKTEKDPVSGVWTVRNSGK